MNLPSTSPKKKNPRVSVRRKEKSLGEYHPLQLASLLETGFLEKEDVCQHPETGDWISIPQFLESGAVPGFSRKVGRAEPVSDEPVEERDPEENAKKIRWTLPWVVAALAVFIALGMSFMAWKASRDVADLKASVAAATAKNQELEKQYQQVLFSAREVAASDLVRGRVIIRNKSGKRVALPGIKVKLYARKALEAHLADRQAKIAEIPNADPARFPGHFLKDIPVPLASTTTDSDGRFEFQLPEPGEYILQTSIRSSKTGELRLWFVRFDSRDPLNTPVDITEANAVRQFHPLLMIMDGR